MNSFVQSHPCRRFVLLFMAVLVLSSCGSLLDLPGPVPDLYNLTPKSTYPDSIPRVDWQLVIEEPIAAGGLDSSRIAPQTQGHRTEIFRQLPLDGTGAENDSNPAD